MRIKKKKNGMDLRTRIGIAFLLVIVIPVVLCSVAFFCLVSFKLHRIGRKYGIEDPGIESLYNNVILISRTMDQELNDMEQVLKEEPGKIEDREYLDQVNDTLLQDGAFLVVLKDKNMYFNGSREISNQELLRQLPRSSGAEVSSSSSEVNEGYIQVKDQALLKQVDFSFADGSRGRIYLISALNQVAPELRNSMVEIVMLILVFLSLTCLFMGIWIYRGVMTPIQELKKATQNIRDGNLDFTIEGNGVKEINDLCEDFDEMRKRLKESAEEKVVADNQFRELLSNISHDLKTPVTAIRGYAEGLRDGVADTPEKRDRYVQTIYNKTLEITSLVDELTTYSKINTNRIPYNFTKLYVKEYFEDCVEELSMELEQQNIGLYYFNYLKGNPEIIADPEQLRRVINNIVGNSVKYMDKSPGVINIRLRDVGDFIQVEIEDNGRGIAQKDLMRIFDRFYRSDTARSSSGGSGIGLSIVKKIIEDHEGKVWVTSKEGVGTVVYFVLRKYQEAGNEQSSDH